MLGAFARAAPQALFAAVIAAFLSRVMSYIMPIILDSPDASESDPLVSGLMAVSSSDNFLLVGLLALLLTLLGRAMVEAKL